MSGDGTERVVAAIQNGRGRSRLYRWLKARHDTVQAALDDDRADWRALAATFAELGLGGTVERPMKPETARHCWYRVRKAVAASRAKRLARGRAAPVGVGVTPPVPPAAPHRAHPAGNPLAELRSELNHRSGRDG